MKAPRIGLRAVSLLAVAALALAACGGDSSDAALVATEEDGASSSRLVITSSSNRVVSSGVTATVTAVPTTETPAPATPPLVPEYDPVTDHGLDATRATITLDGQADDWADVPGGGVLLVAIPEELLDKPTFGAYVTATVKVAFDDANIYLLLLVPDGYDYDPDNRHRSPALAIEWLIDEAAGAAMGSLEPDFENSGGMVDIWHWELDCGPGELSGGVFPTGNDPGCNLDDEYATLTDEREDDDRDNSLTGSWDHTGRASGVGTDGTFVFEIARPLRTDDAQDAQFQLGATARLAIAYWDGNEGREEDGGWTATGHVTSADDGWIAVSLRD